MKGRYFEQSEKPIRFPYKFFKKTWLFIAPIRKMIRVFTIIKSFVYLFTKVKAFTFNPSFSSFIGIGIASATLICKLLISHICKHLCCYLPYLVIESSL